MNKKYQVFVSSTYNDLKEERSEVIRCLLDNDCIPVGMEQFNVPMNQWEYITKCLDNTDYCVLILAGKYGSLEESSGIGYTEKEFDYAVAKNIPVIRLVYEHLDNLIVNKSETEPDKKNKLLSFREKVLSGKLASFYTNMGDLKTKLVTSINQAIKHFPRYGWVRYDQLQKEIATNSDLQKRIEELERQLKNAREEKFTAEDIAEIFADNNSPAYKKVAEIAQNTLDANTATDEDIQAIMNGYFK